jgi:hypothetical protein
MLRLLTQGLSDSPVLRAAQGATTMQRLAAVNDSPVMRAARVDATWSGVVSGEPALAKTLRQPSWGRA